MNILYFGTVCDLNTYEQIIGNCRTKPSIAPIVFESALLSGFYENDIKMEIHSYPMIPTFPQSSMIRFGRNYEKLNCGYECRWLDTINIPVLKQLSRRMDARKMLKKWLKTHKEDCAIVTYSIPPFLVKDIIHYAKKNNVKMVAIIPDLLRDMYINERKTFITTLKMLYLAPALHLQSEFDGYVYLTEAMKNVVAPEKPYIVMEGLANLDIYNSDIEDNTSKVRSIMYAGMMHEKYGIVNLLDAFENIDSTDVELWLFGEGTAVDIIKERQKKNTKIRFFGRRDRETVIAYEKRATLLINPRNIKDEFTEYSFPSKMIEYMLSGTPVITTKLKGIPISYYDYVFLAEDNEINTLTKVMSYALSLDYQELQHMGERAKEFIIREKNPRKQAKRIADFIKEI